MKRNKYIYALIVIGTLCVSACSSLDGETYDIVGIGSNFPEPYYLSSFDAYNTKTGKNISYDGVGSYSARDSLASQAVDFAACDEFISDKMMAQLNMKPVIHVPTCIIGIAVSYNLPGIKKLRLTGDILADIYMGRIRRWNDERIKAINPKDSMPDKRIIPVFRPDGCGRTFLFSSYLSAVSPEWKSRYGSHMLVKFPVGKPVKSNSALASAVQDIPYSIGYVGANFANVVGLPVAEIRNANGEFILPTTKSSGAAACIKDMPTDSRVLLVNSPAKGAYPICSFTWMIIYQEQNYNNRTETQAINTVNLMQYMLSDAVQCTADDDEYAPLPDFIIKNTLSNLKKVTYNGTPILK